METTLLCMKFNQKVDTNLDPCPHPTDYCKYRDGCIINRLCMDRKDCRERKKAARADASGER